MVSDRPGMVLVALCTPFFVESAVFLPPKVHSGLLPRIGAGDAPALLIISHQEPYGSAGAMGTHEDTSGMAFEAGSSSEIEESWPIYDGFLCKGCE